MSDSAILSIDLGSAYTKIAVRRGWNQSTKLLTGVHDATDDYKFCIPSVVARVKRGGEDKYLTGAAAAALTANEGAQLFAHWKSTLFQASGQSELEELTPVVRAFFAGLRKSIGGTLDGAELQRIPARVCLPKLSGFDRVAAFIADVMRDIGWKSCDRCAIVSEPEANVWGVVTRGRNLTWVPPKRDFQPYTGARQVKLYAMLEPSTFLRRLQNMNGRYSILLVDVGAFTTDFAFVSFDASFSSDSWKIPLVQQQSIELGIASLDFEVKGSFSRKVADTLDSLSPAEWDMRKGQLYAGKPIAITTVNGSLRVDANEMGMVKEMIGEFADRVAREAKAFIRKHVRDQGIHGAYLTGGGMMISRIHSGLAKSLQASGYTVESVGSGTRRGYARSAADDLRIRETLELIRGGTAIGAGSVCFDC